MGTADAEEADNAVEDAVKVFRSAVVETAEVEAAVAEAAKVLGISWVAKDFPVLVLL
jgi:hypothetical protein